VSRAESGKIPLGSPLANARKRIAWSLVELAPPAVQGVGIHFKRPRHLYN